MKIKSEKKMGRPRLEVAENIFDGWEQLDALIIWAGQEYIAEQLGMSADTLSRRIRERYGCSFAEYRHKRQEMLRINLRKKQYQVAMEEGNVTMLIWLGKNMLGQSDKNEIKSVEKFNIDSMSSDEKLEMIERYKEKLGHDKKSDS